MEDHVTDFFFFNFNEHHDFHFFFLQDFFEEMKKFLSNAQRNKNNEKNMTSKKIKVLDKQFREQRRRKKENQFKIIRDNFFVAAALGLLFGTHHRRNTARITDFNWTKKEVNIFVLFHSVWRSQISFRTLLSFNINLQFTVLSWLVCWFSGS